MEWTKELQGKRCILRLSGLEDMDTILGFRNSGLVRPYFVYREIITPEVHRAWYKKEGEGGRAVQYLILAPDDREPLGVACLTRYEPAKAEAEWGIFLGKERAYGNGLAREAFRLLAAEGFQVLGLKRLRARVLADNLRSLKYHLAVGFREEQRVKKDGAEVIFLALERDRFFRQPAGLDRTAEPALTAQAPHRAPELGK